MKIKKKFSEKKKKNSTKNKNKISMKMPFFEMLPPLQSSLLSDKLKRPFKKRHNSLPHPPTSRVNKYLAQAIEARSVPREQAAHVSVVTLCFRDREKERQVREVNRRLALKRTVFCLFTLINKSDVVYFLICEIKD